MNKGHREIIFPLALLIIFVAIYINLPSNESKYFQAIIDNNITINATETVSVAIEEESIEYSVTVLSELSNLFAGRQPNSMTESSDGRLMIGGGTALVFMPEGINGQGHDVSVSLLSFEDLDVNVVEFYPGSDEDGTDSGWFVGGGYDNLEGHILGPRLNLLQNCSTRGCETIDYSTAITNVMGNTGLAQISCRDVAVNDNVRCMFAGINGKIVSFDGTSFKNISTKFNIHRLSKLEWNGEYWLVGGTRYSPPTFPSREAAIFRYKDDVVVSVLQSNFETDSSIDFKWNGRYWLISKGPSPVQVWKFDGSALTNITTKAVGKYNLNATRKLGVANTDEAWYLAGNSVLIMYRDGIAYDLNEISDVGDGMNNRFRFAASLLDSVQNKIIVASPQGDFYLLSDEDDESLPESSSDDEFQFMTLVRNCASGDTKVYAQMGRNAVEDLLVWVNASADDVLLSDPEFFGRVQCISHFELDQYSISEQTYTSLDQIEGYFN